MNPTVYFAPGDQQSYKDLGRARRAFTEVALKGYQAVMVREDGMEFEMTINRTRTDEVIVRRFSTFNQVESVLVEALPSFYREQE